jgi:hypothetical protein
MSEVVYCERSEIVYFERSEKRTWRNWYTRSLEEAVPQGVEVQLLSSAQI